MDAQRPRRRRDEARRAWYAYYRQARFARWFGFIGHDMDFSRAYRRASVKDAMSRLPVQT
jgi:hypothetical protein